jgi:GxxExxY protein
MEFDDLSNHVIGCAIEVHRHLGLGLLESAYEQCLAHERSRNNIAFQLQLAQPVRYKDVLLDCGYRVDVLVENLLMIELKSIEQLLGIHKPHC